MRKRYKLPGGRGWWWCGSAAVGDCVKWLCCWSCALAQEVRTANFYDVEDDRFVAVVGARDGEGRPVLVPLPREASATTHAPRSMSCPPKLDGAPGGDGGGVTSSFAMEMAAVAAMGRSATYHPMRAPLPPLIQMDREE